mmetsp:Transcript_32066/g.75224  ORF Transcript_32066/g.75224 Transcript_32066/m.75224 type:complete len:208 (+) Transcript_32066:639-1262(+)
MHDLCLLGSSRCQKSQSAFCSREGWLLQTPGAQHTSHHAGLLQGKPSAIYSLSLGLERLALPICSIPKACNRPQGEQVAKSICDQDLSIVVQEGAGGMSNFEERRPLYHLGMAHKWPSPYRCGGHCEVFQLHVRRLAQGYPQQAIHNERSGHHKGHRLWRDSICYPYVAGELLMCSCLGKPILHFHVGKAQQCDACADRENIPSKGL